MTKAVRLELHFTNAKSPELIRTYFDSPHTHAPIVGCRGEAFSRTLKPFKWVTSTHALSIALLGAAKQHYENIPYDRPVLVGGTPSAASSLYYLIKRDAVWLLDLFGVDPSGNTLLKRMFRFVNAHRTRPGDVEVYLWTSRLPQSAIKVFVDQNEISTYEEICALHAALEKSFKSYLGVLEQRRPAKRVQASKQQPYLEIEPISYSEAA